MCFVYVVRHGATLGINGGLLTIKYPGAPSEEIPKGLVEGISIFAKVVMTSSFSNYCMSNGIKVGFFSKDGVYKGCLSGIDCSGADKIRKQVILSTEEAFQLDFAKRVVGSKINNQVVVAKRYSSKLERTSGLIEKLRYIRKNKVEQCSTVAQILGYEGVASRYYFNCLSQAVGEDFRFHSRTRRPAKDPFNVMLNIGYSVLSKEIYGELVNRNINPYIGFIHKDKPGHAALVSDLIEEWRPVIVDSTVMNMISRHEVDIDDFLIENGKCTITDNALKIYLSKLENKMQTKSKYLKYIDKEVSFREAIWHQADRLSRTIDRGNVALYQPINVR